MSTKKILVVDDEPDIVKWLTVLFENSGYIVIQAIDGNEGLTKAQEEKPDLITLDISMPNESGIKMYRSLCDSDSLKAIPVVMLTGVSREFERFISSRKQVPAPAAYFEKPVKDHELLDKIKELIN
ncbi:MAG: response regulator [candidate division Zixibacteria bacterium]|nr:response regulator [candidate division Zixibacteria bacterium]